MLHIDTSQICNLNCIYCCEWWREGGYLLSVKKQRIKTNPKIWDRNIFLSLLKNRNEWYIGVVFSKWEPTMNPTLKRAIVFAKKLWYKKIEVVSNGLRLADEKYLQSLIDAWLTHLTISYNSIFPQIHSYVTGSKDTGAKTFHAIILALKYKLHLHINIVLTKMTLIGIDKTILALKKIGVQNIIISYIRYGAFDRTEKMFPSFHKTFLNQVSYGEIISYFQDKKNILEWIIWNDFPFCVLSQMWVFHNVGKVKDYHFYDAKKGKQVKLSWIGIARVFPDLCNTCIEKKSCCGLEKDYYKLYKENLHLELKPYQ